MVECDVSWHILHNLVSYNIIRRYNFITTRLHITLAKMIAVLSDRNANRTDKLCYSTQFFFRFILSKLFSYFIEHMLKPHIFWTHNWTLGPHFPPYLGLIYFLHEIWLQASQISRLFRACLLNFAQTYIARTNIWAQTMYFECVYLMIASSLDMRSLEVKLGKTE